MHKKSSIFFLNTVSKLSYINIIPNQTFIQYNYLCRWNFQSYVSRALFCDQINDQRYSQITFSQVEREPECPVYLSFEKCFQSYEKLQLYKGQGLNTAFSASAPVYNHVNVLFYFLMHAYLSSRLVVHIN